MAISEKLEADVEIKASADAFLKMFCHQAHQISSATPQKIHAVKLHEGDWETPGSIKHWTYTIDGGKTVETFKEKVHVDEDKKLVILEAQQTSTVLQHYKTYKVFLHATPKEEGCIVKLTIEYEKLNANVPPPQHYLEWGISVLKDVGSHLKP